MPAPDRPRSRWSWTSLGFYLLTAYKAALALLVLSLAVYLLTHGPQVLASVQSTLQRWSLQGGWLGLASASLRQTLRGLPASGPFWTGVLLLIDGLLLALTALALAKRWPAARGLVLTAIGLFLLPELALLWQHRSLAVAAVLAFNLAILAYVYRYYPRH